MIKGWLIRLLHWWLNLAGKDRATLILEILGIVVVIAYTTVAKLQWKQMKKAAKAAESANEVATNTLRKSQRPWIKIEIVGNTVYVTDKVIPPGTHVPGYEAIGLTAQILARNTGTSPAVKGVVQTSISTGATIDVTKQTNAMCGTVNEIQRENIRFTPPGFVIFPNDSQPLDIATSRAKSELGEKNLLVGCAVYRDQYGINHHTRFCFEWIDPKNATETVKPCQQNWDAD